MKRIFWTALIAAALLNTSYFGIAEGAEDAAYLASKYREALDKGCSPVIVKRTITAALLGLLPGGGLFYTGDRGRAIRDFMLWPLGSFLWDPVLAVKSARVQNMQATITACQAGERKAAAAKLLYEREIYGNK